MSEKGILVSLSVFLVFACFGTPIHSDDKNLTEVIKASGPSVVVVTAYDVAGKEIGIGTGFVVREGIVATSLHVVSDAVSAEVRTSGGPICAVTGPFAIDRVRDLALLRVETLPELHPLVLRVDEPLNPGETVIAMGHPLGLEFSPSVGVFAGTRALAGFGKIIQFTAPVSPGNSGGPLLDAQGKVIGVVTFRIVEGQLLNFAVSATHLNTLLVDGEVSGEIGLLPWKTRTIERTVSALHSEVSLPLYNGVRFDQLIIQGERRGKRFTLTRKDSSEKLPKGSYFLTPAGVLVFSGYDRGRLWITYTCRPRKVVVFVESDSTGIGLAALAVDRFARMGDEVISGPEVQTLLHQYLQQGPPLGTDLAQVLQAARLVIVKGSTTSDIVYGYGPGKQILVTLKLELVVLDLNTGGEMLREHFVKRERFAAGEVSAKRIRQLAENWLDSVLRPFFTQYQW